MRLIWPEVDPMTTYGVTYERDEEGWWIGRIGAVPGVHSNGRTIAETRRRVREALALAVDDADDAVFEDDVRLPREVKAALRLQEQARARADLTRAAATGAQRAAARLLIDDVKLSLRDAGELLGVSQTMVKKLAEAEASLRRKREHRRRPRSAASGGRPG